METFKKDWKRYLPALFFPLVLIYEELILQLFAADMPTMGYHVLYILAFSLSGGLLLWLLVDLCPNHKARSMLSYLLTFLMAVITCVEFCCRSFFKTFFEVGYMLHMAGDVTSQFSQQTNLIIMDSLPFIAASLLPLVLLAVFRKLLLPAERSFPMSKGVILALCIVIEAVAVQVIFIGTGTIKQDRNVFTSDYSADSAIPTFGVLKSLQLEGVYAIIGIPEAKLPDMPMPDMETPLPEVSDAPVEYGYNVEDIDFEALKAETTNKDLLAMHDYFSHVAPTQKNEYTGMFAGKNLIMLTLEGFSPYVIDPEITPTLYRLATEGFVFKNFYQPDWHQSTTGGEFAAMTGLIPTNVGGSLSFSASSRVEMPYALGHQFSELGYACRAYHNNTYTFYNRHKTHPNLGYDYKGLGHGLDMPSSTWPASDYEMMLATVDEYINNYVENGEPFHTYYMTVSGHAGYSWAGNRMSRAHKDEVADLPYSETIQAYFACQLEVEYALQYIVEQLEAAGIADDTVIAMTGDHYPYALASGTDYYHELEPVPTEPNEPERFRNAFILWSGSMTEPVEVDVPCSSIDMVPTISNLFGLTYDSRLYSGRDILATNYDVANPASRQPFVVFGTAGAGYSWISLAGEYNGYTRSFTPYPGYEDYADNADYIQAMCMKAKTMTDASRKIIAKNYYKVVLPEVVVTPSPEPTAVPAVSAAPSPAVSAQP